MCDKCHQDGEIAVCKYCYERDTRDGEEFLEELTRLETGTAGLPAMLRETAGIVEAAGQKPLATRLRRRADWLDRKLDFTLALMAEFQEWLGGGIPLTIEEVAEMVEKAQRATS